MISMHFFFFFFLIGEAKYLWQKFNTEKIPINSHHGGKNVKKDPEYKEQCKRDNINRNASRWKRW